MAKKAAPTRGRTKSRISAGSEAQVFQAGNAGPQPQSIDMHYLKSLEYREIACDGALGGPTPRGKLWIAFYNERGPLPRVVRHGMVSTGQTNEYRVTDEGQLIEGRSGIVRNVEVGLFMSLQTAEELYAWLAKNIEKMKEGEAGK
jgi:hypothetical protein